jgi:hypothetical protein
MTFPRLETLSDYWQQHPPIHLLMASFVGHKPPNKPKKISKQKKENDFDELMQIFGQVGGKVIKHDGHSKGTI